MTPAEPPSSACYYRKVLSGPTVFPHWNDSHFLSLLTLFLTGQNRWGIIIVPVCWTVIRQLLQYWPVDSPDKLLLAFSWCLSTLNWDLSNACHYGQCVSFQLPTLFSELGFSRSTLKTLWYCHGAHMPVGPLGQGLYKWYGVQGNTHASSFCC